MERVCGLGLFPKCRLCGANGLHELDILENCSPSDELSEKIFRCVGIQVERNDKLTTKICGPCLDKINEFVIFRQICAATNVQLRNELSNFMGEGDGSSVVVDAEPKTRLGIGIPTETQNALIESYSMEYQVLPNRSLDSTGAKRKQRKTIRSTDETQQTSQNVTQTANPQIYISTDDDESQDGVSDANIDNDVMLIENAVAKKQKAKNNKYHRSFEIKCETSRRSNCKASFDSWDAMMYHVTFYHAEGIKKTFECHLCQKSFSTKQNIDQHINEVHSGLRPFKCPNRSCSMLFSRKSNLKRHIDIVHSGLKRFKCPNRKCSELFSTKAHLQRHMKSVHAHSLVQMPKMQRAAKNSVTDESLKIRIAKRE